MSKPYTTIVIDSRAKLAKLKAYLHSIDDVVGVDCETVGVDPRKETPVGSGRIACWSLAVATSPVTLGFFLPNWRGYEWILTELTPWLEDHTKPKCGHKIFNFDRHIFWNHGIEIQGIVGDTLCMSRLQASTNKVNHSLKHLMQHYLGIEPVGEFKDLFSVPTQINPKVYKTTRVTNIKNYPDANGNKRYPGYADTFRSLTCEGEWDTISWAVREPVPLDEVPEKFPKWLPTLVDYSTLDAVATVELYHLLAAKLSVMAPKGVTQLDINNDWWNPALYVLNEAERNGWLIDPEACRAGADRYALEAEEGLRNLYRWTGNDQINYNSYPQLQWLLYGRGLKEVSGNLIEGKGFQVPMYRGNLKAITRTKPGEQPTDEGALHNIRKGCSDQSDIDGINALLSYKKAKKYAQYCTKLPEHADDNGRIHCQIAPATDTGRLSASRPALQQIPGRDPHGIRDAFIATPGHRLLVLDYSQLEMYILAHILVSLFGDESLKSDLLSSDCHGMAAKRCWPDELADVPADQIKGHPEFGHYRDSVKSITYGINYGKSAVGLGAQITDQRGRPIGTAAAQALLDTYMNAYPGIANYQRWVKQYATKHGGVFTLLGRWRPLPEAKHPLEWKQARAHRQALNSPIQGSAADIVTMAMLKCNTKALPELVDRGYYDSMLDDYGVRFIMQIHDELVFEVPEAHAELALPRVKYLMENPLPEGTLKVPLKVDGSVNKTWGEGH